MTIFLHLVYQNGIANVISGVSTSCQWNRHMRRRFQGSFRDAEHICEGAKFAGANVTVWHWDHADDCLSLPALRSRGKWRKGPGKQFASDKRPLEFLDYRHVEHAGEMR